MLKITLNVNLATGDTAYIEADNPQELHTALGYLQSIGALRGPSPAPAGGATDDNPTPDPAEPKVAGSVEPKAEATPAPEKQKRQSKKAEKAASAGAAAPSAETEQTAPAGTAPATDKPKAKPEDVTAAVTALANATSLQQARAVLEQFGVKRAAELKPEQYDAFVAACAKAEAEAL